MNFDGSLGVLGGKQKWHFPPLDSPAALLEVGWACAGRHSQRRTPCCVLKCCTPSLIWTWWESFREPCDKHQEVIIILLRGLTPFLRISLSKPQPHSVLRKWFLLPFPSCDFYSSPPAPLLPSFLFCLNWGHVESVFSFLFNQNTSSRLSKWNFRLITNSVHRLKCPNLDFLKMMWEMKAMWTLLNGFTHTLLCFTSEVLYMGPSSKYAQEMTDKGNICFAQIVVFSHLIKNQTYLRLLCENSTSQVPSDRSARAACETSGCACTLVPESTSSCWPAHGLSWQAEIGVH